MRGPILFKPRKILFFNSHRFALPGMHPAFVAMQQPWRLACQGKRGETGRMDGACRGHDFLNDGAVFVTILHTKFLGFKS